MVYCQFVLLASLARVSMSGPVQRYDLIGQNGGCGPPAPCGFEEAMNGLAQAQGAEVDPRRFGG